MLGVCTLRRVPVLIDSGHRREAFGREGIQIRVRIRVRVSVKVKGLVAFKPIEFRFICVDFDRNDADLIERKREDFKTLES